MLRHIKTAVVSNQRGLSLIELLVAMSIGVFALAAVTIFYIYTLETIDLGHFQVELQDEAILAMSQMTQRITEGTTASIDEYGLGERLSVVTSAGTDTYYASADGNLYRSEELILGDSERGVRVNNLDFTYYAASLDDPYASVDISLGLKDAKNQTVDLTTRMTLRNAP